MTVKDTHTTISNVISLILIGVLGSTLSSEWWSCGNRAHQVHQMLWAGGLLGFYGMGGAYVAHQLKKSEHLKYWLELTLRALLIYALFTTALLKAEGHYYTYSLLDGETKLAQLEASTFANAFYGFSPLFQAYVGYALIGGLVLLSFRKTQRIGNVLLAVILANAIALNISFDSCYYYKNSIYFAVVASFIFGDIMGYYSFFTRKNYTEEKAYHPLQKRPHLNNSLILLKLILLFGLYVHTHYYIEDTRHYRTRNINSPITGVWKVTDVTFLKDDNPSKNRKEIKSFKSIILDKGRYGAVEIEDSLSFFEYIIDPRYNQLEFWNFQDFWHMDIKGKYQQVTPDSMVYIGRNNKDSLQLSLKLQTK